MSTEHQPVPNVVVVAPESSRRLDLMQQALQRLGMSAATHVSYLDLILGRATLADVAQGSIVRIESPGKCFDVERALLCYGLPDTEQEGSIFLSERSCAQLEFDRGLILYPRQWYLGYRRVLRLISQQLANSCAVFMNHPRDVAIMFDKSECQRLLQGIGVRIPRFIGPVVSFDDLKERMRETGIFRVFIKLAHGSSASGAIAYQTDRNFGRHKAVTTVETVRSSSQLSLYNSRKIRTYQNESQIAELVDSLCPHRVHVEAWLPKAVQRSQTFDLRVLVIAGQAAHTVVRLSRTPFTNLHLLNERGDVGEAISLLGQERWKAAMGLCEKVMTIFPDSLYGGIDLLIQPDLKSHAVLEANAFGDLLPGIIFDGADSYELELRHALHRYHAQPSLPGSVEAR